MTLPDAIYYADASQWPAQDKAVFLDYLQSEFVLYKNRGRATHYQIL